ncbi:YdhK family protein [Nesterenkonia halophila]|uniref:YdhK family protein n=1 Tax=Nesterenkonia halophila TaxID=302044 RepID=UPI0012908BB9|nr:YdhK family protein [Nesterenkonia halophila]
MRMAALAAVGVLVVTACSTTTNEESEAPSASEGGGEHQHGHDGGPAPDGIKKASSPEYPVGSTAVLAGGHMENMKGSTATVAGAYDTTIYSVTYTPTTGGDPVDDHKWVAHEELEDPGDAPLQVGDEVTLDADHMPGMQGAEAVIERVTDETAYMVDIETGSMDMTNHKWFVTSELEPAQ